MNNIDVSIIIPVYKAEKYIQNCLDSICNQTYKNFEVILVDDGSPDDSIKVAEEYLCKTNVRFRIVRQQNLGAAAARNTGVRESKGKRIVFVDSDDYLTKSFLSCLVEASNDSQGLVSIVNYKYVGGADLKAEPEHFEESVVWDQKQLLTTFLRRKINIVVTAILISKDIFIRNNLWFDESVRFGEDAIFYWKLLMSQQKIIYNSTPLYNYYVHEGSTTTAPNKERIITNIAGFKKLGEEIKHNVSSEFSDFVLARQFFAVLRIYAVYMTYDEYEDMYELLEFDKWKAILKRFPDYRVRLLCNSMRISKKIFYYLNHRKGS